jgi:hypothetical protein
MTGSQWLINSEDLEVFVNNLEKEWSTQGVEHFCAFLPSTNPPVGRYAWASSRKVDEAVKVICTGCRLHAAARNRSLHKFTVKFGASTKSEQVKLQTSPTQTPASSFAVEIPMNPRPPIRGGGLPVCKGCNIIVCQTFDPTIEINCEFEVIHEGNSVGKISKHIILTPS